MLVRGNWMASYFAVLGFALSEKKWAKAYFGAYERLHNKALFFGVVSDPICESAPSLTGKSVKFLTSTFVAPLERLKLEYIVRGEQRNLFELIKAIAVSQGLKGFWKGNFVNILRTAPFKSINFYAYDTYRNQLLKMSGNEETTNFERFVAGAAAPITATSILLVVSKAGLGFYCIVPTSNIDYDSGISLEKGILLKMVKTCYVPALPRHKELIAELRPIHTKLSCQKEIARRHPVFKCNEVQVFSTLLQSLKHLAMKDADDPPTHCRHASTASDMSSVSSQCFSCNRG
ncbi:hypothetical protein RHGRI_033857 [Rhododendron griersonianum]|uniref:Uncharacterized protein n=1 Tax=Rhododendron griersonianum TaxID=479676 RepID=A0AAV6HYB7_9ERIC|nr:hypothetical protein RHGRI_033857 [Rhododendron griersonianum]